MDDLPEENFSLHFHKLANLAKFTFMKQTWLSLQFFFEMLITSSSSYYYHNYFIIIVIIIIIILLLLLYS